MRDVEEAKKLYCIGQCYALRSQQRRDPLGNFPLVAPESALWGMTGVPRGVSICEIGVIGFIRSVENGIGQ
jgi:hypothetical protein